MNSTKNYKCKHLYREKLHNLKRQITSIEKKEIFTTITTENGPREERDIGIWVGGKQLTEFVVYSVIIGVNNTEITQQKLAQFLLILSLNKNQCLQLVKFNKTGQRTTMELLHPQLQEHTQGQEMFKFQPIKLENSH